MLHKGSRRVFPISVYVSQRSQKCGQIRATSPSPELSPSSAHRIRAFSTVRMEVAGCQPAEASRMSQPMRGLREGKAGKARREAPGLERSWWLVWFAGGRFGWVGGLGWVGLGWVGCLLFGLGTSMWGVSPTGCVTAFGIGTGSGLVANKHTRFEGSKRNWTH